MAIKFDHEIGPDWAQNLSLKLNIDDLGGVRLDHTIPHVDVIRGNALRLLILELDLESGAQIILVDDLNLLGLGVLEEAIVELEELVWLDAHSWYDTLGLDRYCEHILTNTL